MLGALIPNIRCKYVVDFCIVIKFDDENLSKSEFFFFRLIRNLFKIYGSDPIIYKFIQLWNGFMYMNLICEMLSLTCIKFKMVTEVLRMQVLDLLITKYN